MLYKLVNTFNSPIFVPLDIDEPLEEEEIVRVTYQVMINHPLNSNLMQVSKVTFIPLL